VLENPDAISKLVLSRGLDSGTAFEILSIDIADVDVGKNIGAAQEQEMSALVEERRAAVVEAEAEIPRAISDSFRSGHLGIMDYYRMKNIQADTQMREGLSKGEKRGVKGESE
jgi:uncharacterized protein YqfA (UPF0365 family)